MSKYERYPRRTQWIEFAAYLGVRIEILPGMPDYNYLGTGVIQVAKHIDDEDLLHEIAHWIVAPPHLRSACEFGCGTSNEAIRSCRPADTNYQSYEEQASLTGIAIQYAAGDATWKRTHADHNWDDTISGPSPKTVLQRLRERRLVSSKGIPLAYLRYAKSRGEGRDLQKPLTDVFRVLK